MGLAKTQLREDIATLQKDMEDPTESQMEEDKKWVSQRKVQLTTKMKRLIPGSSNATIGAIKTQEEIITNAEGIAQELKRHWEKHSQKGRSMSVSWKNGWTPSLT